MAYRNDAGEYEMTTWAEIQADEFAAQSAKAFNASRQLTWWRNELAQLPKGDYRLKAYRTMVADWEADMIHSAQVITASNCGPRIA